ncbi:MAG: WD40 repeat domain-containing protein [Phycisphaerales bacterium]|nr:WD40 repeat domain-containing protein [Phycisphaerales bacterium]
MDRVRHIATTWDGDRVAAAQFEERVAVWNLRQRQQVSEFDTILGFGGRRLCITRDGRFVVAATYHTQGVACYDANDGTLCWQRRGLKTAQHVSIDDSSGTVLVSFEMRSALALDLATGSELSTARDVRKSFVSPHTQARALAGKSGTVRIFTAPDPWSVRVRHPVLTIAFSPTAVAISEMGGPVSCYALETGQEQWRQTWLPNEHAIRIGYVAAANAFACVASRFDRGTQDLVLIGVESGAIAQRHQGLSSPEFGFACRGSRVLLWDGSLIDTTSGVLVSKLPFPDVSQPPAS